MATTDVKTRERRSGKIRTVIHKSQRVTGVIKWRKQGYRRRCKVVITTYTGRGEGRIKKTKVGENGDNGTV